MYTEKTIDILIIQDKCLRIFGYVVTFSYFTYKLFYLLLLYKFLSSDFFNFFIIYITNNGLPTTKI